MKICILTTAFPRWEGDDRGSFVLSAALALVKQGMEVQVIAIHSPGAKKREVMDGIEVIRPMYLPSFLEVLQKEGGGLPVVWKKYPLARLALIPFVLVQILATAYYGRNCDVIHANWTLSGIIAWISQIFHRRPFIVTVHGSDIYQSIKTGWIRFLTRISLQNANMVIAVSSDLARTTSNLGVPSEKILVIPDGINVELFTRGKDERENIVLFTGSLIPRKGLIFLLQAFPFIIQACPDAQLMIAGEGVLEENLKHVVHSLKIEDHVHFLGSIPQKEVSVRMRQSKVFVLPSLEEGLGVVLLEALASGTPCVASDVGGIPDVVTDQVGILVPPGNPEALARSIVRILQNPNYWQALSCSARQRAVNDFSWDIISGRLMSVYLAVLKGNQV